MRYLLISCNSLQEEMDPKMSNAKQKALPTSASSESIEMPSPIDGFPRFGYIELSSMHNTRDLGGMPTMDGRRIRPRKLLRSGELHNISESDAITILGNHDVRHVVDFRTRAEFEHAPDDPIMYEMASYHHLPVFGSEAIGITHASGIGETLDMLIAGATNLRATVEGSYAKAVLGEMGMGAYRKLIDIVAEAAEEEDGGAVLWHCSAGKDRTGIAAIFIEHILGVSEENIKRDYLATNIFSKRRNQDLPYSLAPVLRAATGIDISPIFYVYSAYYDELMALIERRFGYLSSYISNALGISDAEQEVIRRGCLE